jgi:hypothetical protein
MSAQLAKVLERGKERLSTAQEDWRVDGSVHADFGCPQIFDHVHQGRWVVRFEGDDEFLVAQPK